MMMALMKIPDAMTSRLTDIKVMDTGFSKVSSSVINWSAVFELLLVSSIISVVGDEKT